MAEADSTAALHPRQSQFRDLSVIDILKMMKSHTDDIMREKNRVGAVAYGGVCYAGGSTDSGNILDETSANLFDVITEIAGECGELYDLQAAIAELTAREMIAQAKTKA